MSNKIYYVSCSELVTHLNVWKIEDVRKALAKIVEVASGWELAIYKSSLGLKQEDRFIGTVTDLSKLQIVTGKYGDPKLFYPLRTKDLEVDEFEESRIVLANKDRSDYLYLQFGDFYCDNTSLTLRAQEHVCNGEFEPLAKTIRALGTKWHTHDGGSPINFEEWCEKNGFQDVAKRYGD